MTAAPLSAKDARDRFARHQAVIFEGRRVAKCDHGISQGLANSRRFVTCEACTALRFSDPMRPAVDRALDGDHRLCSLDPCSDCR